MDRADRVDLGPFTAEETMKLATKCLDNLTMEDAIEAIRNSNQEEIKEDHGF